MLTVSMAILTHLVGLYLQASMYLISGFDLMAMAELQSFCQIC